MVIHNVFRFYRRSFSYIYTYKMNTVYIKYNADQPQFQITFHYKYPRYGIDRVFNFSRTLAEKVETCMDRMKTNIEKEFTKKITKTNKKQSKVHTTASEKIPLITVQLLNEEKELVGRTFQEIFLDDNIRQNLFLQILDDKLMIKFNTPWVNLLVLPISILAGYFIYPAKIELQFSEKKFSTITWYSGLLPKSNNEKDIIWNEVGIGYTYDVKTEDINHKLKVKCIPSNGKDVGPAVEIISNCTVQPGPGICPYHIRHSFTTKRLSGKKFRVVTYNLLADLYSDSDYAKQVLFAYCPPYALSMDYRKQLFIKEIIGYNADIICLQEVDTKIFDLDLEVILGAYKFIGCLKKKGESGEGVATFINTERFVLIKHEGINIGENIKTLPSFKVLWEKIQPNTQLVDRIVERGTAIQITVVRSIDNSDKYLLIANTHLYFHPDADHIRLLQIGFSMLYVEQILNEMKNNLNIKNENISIIFCGDFNSVPECGIYKLLTEKFVGDDFIDWESNKNEAVKNVTLSQPFNMKSACGCPKYTNYTVGFKECLDYIFYQTDKLQVSQVIPLPSEEELSAHIAIPSVVFPSDHVALVSDLEWTEV